MISSMESTISQLEDITQQLKLLNNQNKQNEQSEKELKDLRVKNWELERQLEAQRKETEKWKQICFQQNKR